MAGRTFGKWMRSRWHWESRTAVYLIALAATIILAILWRQWAPSWWGWDFRNNLWAPAHLLLAGGSPYDLSEIFPGSQAVWFPQIIGVLFPLGWLSLEQALALWGAATITALVTMVLMVVMKGERPSLVSVAVIALLIVLFPPIHSHLSLGQITIFISLAYLIVAGKSEKWYAPLLVALALTKPQLGVLVVPGLLVVRWQGGGYKAAVHFAGNVVLFAVAFSVPLFLAKVDWLVGFLDAQSNNPAWAHPSLLVATVSTFGGEAGFILWLALFLVVFAINAIVWQRIPPERAVLWSLALTPLVTPYVWSWDFVMMLPLVIHLLLTLAYPVLVMFTFIYAAVWYRFAAAVLSGGINQQHWWVPTAVIVLSMAMSALDSWWPRWYNPSLLQSKEGRRS